MFQQASICLIVDLIKNTHTHTVNNKEVTLLERKCTDFDTYIYVYVSDCKHFVCPFRRTPNMIR